MDAFIFNFNNLKTEKQNAMLWYRRLENITKLFRIIEFCLILVLLLWIPSSLPFFLEICNKYICKFISIIISRLFIFLISNVIVITLLAKSGKLTASGKPDTDTFEEVAKKIESIVNLEPENCAKESEKELVYQDKRIMDEINTVTCDSFVQGALVPELLLDQKVLRRSQSENFKVDALKKACGKLRRSETEISRKTERSNQTLAECVEELSNEEFQRTIEAFIEKQLRFHKDEKFAIVSHIWLTVLVISSVEIQINDKNTYSFRWSITLIFYSKKMKQQKINATD